MSPTLKAKTGRFINRPVFAYVIVLGALMIGVLIKSHQDSAAIRASQVAGCERGKLDRLDHARVYRAMSSYYDGVIHAASVKGDVKIIASRVRDELDDAARGQASRILLCVPLLDGREIPDRQLLRQLPGR